jgi:hypothetical protein
MSEITRYHVSIGATAGLRLANTYTLGEAAIARQSVRGVYLLYREGVVPGQVRGVASISLKPDDYPQPEAGADAEDLLNLVRWYQAHEHAPGRCVLALLQYVGPFLAGQVLQAKTNGTPVPEEVLDLCEALAGLT